MELHGILVLLLSILGLFAGPAAAVYGGYDTDVKAYPHQASLEEITNNKPRYIGNGAVVSRQIVVTVASLVKGYGNRPYDLLVRVGSPTTGSGGEERNVANVYRHRDERYDIAVLRLSKAISASSVYPIKITGINNKPQIGETVFTSSWGRSNAGAVAYKLQHAPMRVIRGDNDGCYCPCLMNGTPTSNNFSARYEVSTMLYLSNNPYDGTCDNDGGAPLVGKNGLLVGLATLNFGCYSSRRESLYTDLSNREIWYFVQSYL